MAWRAELDEPYPIVLVRSASGPVQRSPVIVNHRKRSITIDLSYPLGRLVRGVRACERYWTRASRSRTLDGAR